MATVAETPQVETSQELEARLRKELKEEYEGRFQIWQAKDLADLAEKQQVAIREEVTKLVKEYQEKQKPLTAEQIQKMLEQEYAEVPLTLFVDVDNEDIPQKRTFTLRELPQSVERKFYKQFIAVVKDQAPKMEAFKQKSMDQPFEKILMDFLEACDGGFELMAGAVALILNPFNKDTELTAAWVGDHISSNRQLSIVLAQAEVNKLRDFFSKVFLDGQKALMSLTPQNSQQ
jgi:hypothetical protein